MAHAESTRIAVRGSFIYERLNLQPAAQKHGVSYNTARVWKKNAKAAGDDWDKARSASLMTEGGLPEIAAQIIENFALIFQSTVQDFNEGIYDPIQKTQALASLSDAFTKTMKTAGAAEPKIAELSVALETLKMLVEFIKSDYPDMLESFDKMLDHFAIKINERFG